MTLPYRDKKSVLLIILSAFFITNAIVAEFIGGKIFSLEATLGFEPLQLELFGVGDLGFNLTAGVLMWPVVFIMTDIINEYYGTKTVRFLSYLTAGVILYAFLIVFAAIEVNPNEWWKSQSGLLDPNTENHIADMNLAFKKVMGQGLWIILGSLVAFLVGQVIDVLVFHRIKKATGENKLWMRSTVSTIISQFIDSFVVLFIAFYLGSNWELSRVLAIGCMNYIYKFVVALLLIPIIYLVHYAIEKYLGEVDAEAMKREAMRE